MPNLDAALLERLTRDIFAARGVPPDDAAWVATMLVRANLRGHDSHGVIRVPQYAAALKSGTLNPKPQMTLVVDTPTIAILDGDGGFGQVVARRGIGLAIERARAQGLAAVALRGANHVGRLADYAEMAAQAGLIGLLWANARGGLNVAPWGGAARRLGTNPHAIAVPGPNGVVSMSHDFASSVWAEGKLRVKFNRGETVPPGIMLNGRGEPSVFRNGSLMVCIDPVRFLPLAEFHAQVAGLLDWVRSAPLAAGAKEILIPGEPEARMERERRAAGVPIEDTTWQQIQQAAEEVGVRA